MGNQVLIYGSSAGRMIRLLSTGAPACVTVTILGGLVLGSHLACERRRTVAFIY